MESENSKPINTFWEAADVQRSVRVALYDETNGTQPAYVSIGSWTTNVTPVELILVDAGFEVTRVTEEDVEGSDILRTALFDVFVMVDNNPRTSMDDEIMNFWLGGGGILSIDGSINFLCQNGVLIPASNGDNGYGTFWNYDSSVNQTVLNRHPVSQDYAIGDEITSSYDWATVDMTTLTGYSYYSEYTVITHSDTGPTAANTLVRDCLTQGRVAQIFGWLTLEPTHAPMIVESINWLCPKPKARVVFDYTHFPYYGIDAGDPSGHGGNRYATWRDALVERTYTVDKLLPSAEGNLTYENLAPYDVLIINTPEWNFTAAEVTAVAAWVQDGGGLICLGDWTSAFTPENQNMNYLLTSFDLFLSDLDYPVFAFSTTDSEMHPTREYVSTTHYEGGVYVNITGDAYPLWYNGSNIVSAAQEYGMGRVFLAGDINFLGNFIASDNNEQFGINIVNWISSGPAKVLLYTDEPYSANWHQTPVALALNELDVDYFLTVTEPYVNLSLHLNKDWELLIVDNPWWGLGAYYEAFANHILDNGKFIMSGYQVDSHPSDPLWPLLGFEFAGELLSGPNIHIWDEEAPIFNQPYDFGALNFSRAVDYGDEGDLVTVFDNATALAGFTVTEQPGNATIVVRDDGRTLYNAYLIDQFSGDNDDSTYADNFELWLNEIAFMLRVSIDEPGNVVYTEGETGNEIVWHPHSLLPAEYIIERDGTPIEHELWLGGPIVLDVDGLAAGTYQFAITVMDRAGYEAADVVEVTVEEVVTTPTTTPTTPPPTLPGDPTLLLIIAAAAGGVIVIVIILIMMKKKG